MKMLADWWMKSGVDIAMDLVYAIILILVGYVASRICGAIVSRSLGRTRFRDNEMLIRFLSRSVALGTLAVAFVMALDKIRVDVKTLVAGMGVTGFIAGFAFRDVLSNFAAGLMVVAYRPFNLNDQVTVGGVTGRVEEINAVSTVLRTEENQQLIVPNSRVWGTTITNFDAYKRRAGAKGPAAS